MGIRPQSSITVMLLRGLTSKLIAVMLFTCLIVVIAPLQANADGERIQNGGFEDVRSGVPNMWSQDVYLQGENVSRLTVEQGNARTGNYYLRIYSLEPNDAKWVQTIKVKPGTVYKLSSWVRAENVGLGGSGANISVLGIGNISSEIRETQGEWEYVEFIGETGANQDELTVAIRLGSYGSLNTGIADFDDFSLEEIRAASADNPTEPFYPQETSVTVKSSHPAFSVTMILFAVLYIALFTFIMIWLDKYRDKQLIRADQNRRSIFVLLASAFIIRLLCAPIIEGHPIDFMDFNLWADHAYSKGLTEFYSGDIFADYPPGYVYVLYLLGMIKHLFVMDVHSSATVILMKLPAMIADILSGYVIYRMAEKRLGYSIALSIALLYVLNPNVFINSTVWAQIDSVLTLIILLMIHAAADKQLPKAGMYYVIALLIKPQALIFAPLLLYPIIEQRNWKTVSRTALSGLITLIVCLIPFTLHKPPLWIVNHYLSMFGMYPFSTFNGFNLYALFGDNGVNISEKWLSVSYHAWDAIFIVAIVTFTGYLFFKSKNQAKYMYIALLIVLLVFAFKTGMHERYGFPAVLLALASYIHLRDKRVLYLFIGVSLTHFANVAYVLQLSFKEIYFVDNSNGFMRVIALANMVLTFYAIRLGYLLLVKPKDAAPSQKQQPIKPQPIKKANAIQVLPDVVTKLSKTDHALMWGLTAIYSAIALFHLGTLSSPQTFWKPVNAGESFQVEMKKNENIGSISWYGGIGEGDFILESSEDAASWTPITELRTNGGTVFTWQREQLSFTAKYVRVTAKQPEASLGELGFFEAGNNEPILVEASVRERDDGNLNREYGYRNVLDEQQDVPYLPSYRNSMYFDEIYHGRTAYEHLHQMEPYETTHPPLGKVLMSAGIAIFGMNPFGWRIVGTLLGIAMIPVMYLFGRRLFGHTKYAFIAAFLMTFDFMHFTQTRIATIDVFGVFFILLMYYFMYRYYTLSFHRTPFAKTLVPLGLAGLFFGLGTASKWIGLYAGIGLAVILFLSLREQYKVNRNRKEKTVRPFSRHVLATLACSFIFFVIVPAIVYLCSYIPFMLVPGPGHGLSDVVSYQKFMFDYHRNLVAEHPFASVWWEWPFIKKPIWYYAGQFLPQGKMSSIVAMGNPAIWWTGIVAVTVSGYSAYKKRDKKIAIVLIGLASQYLPWIGVTRLTFIYHFFASIPFVILCIVYTFKIMDERKMISRKWTIGYLGAVLLLFILFYPILSGAVIDKAYAIHYLRWFDSWIF